MSQTLSVRSRRQKWYDKNMFPLIPIIETRKANKYNTSHFSFRWLFFTFWTLDLFQLELAFTIDTHFGVGINFSVPYFRGIISIPCPKKLGYWIDRKLSRRPSLIIDRES